MHFKMSSAISLNLSNLHQSKILSSGNGLKSHSFCTMHSTVFQWYEKHLTVINELSQKNLKIEQKKGEKVATSKDENSNRVTCL